MLLLLFPDGMCCAAAFTVCSSEKLNTILIDDLHLRSLFRTGMFFVSHMTQLALVHTYVSARTNEATRCLLPSARIPSDGKVHVR